MWAWFRNKREAAALNTTLLALLIELISRNEMASADLSKLSAVIDELAKRGSVLSADVAALITEVLALRAGVDQPAVDALQAKAQTVLDGVNQSIGSAEATVPPAPVVAPAA